MSHTKGKLKTRGFYAVDERGRAVFDCGPVPMEDEEIKANARRLVACWNALSDVSTEDIENTVFIPPEVTYRELEKQRDELVTVLRKVIEDTDRIKGDLGYDTEDEIRSVLSRYQEGRS